MCKKLFGLALVLCLLIPAVFAESSLPAYLESLENIDKNTGSIDLGEHVIKDIPAFSDWLATLPKLTRCDMFNTPIKAAEMDALQERFPGVRFGWTIRIAEHTLRTDQTAFSTLHNNRKPQHSSRDFAVLKHCHDLVALDLGHNAIDDLSFLNDLPQLKILILAANKIVDISPLANQKELEYVELFKNRIRDISPLKDHKHLKDLNLCFNSVKDYEPLLGLTSLERLWLYNSNTYSDIPIPREIQKQIKEALPHAKVDFTSYSTLGGWREHPRYFDIFDIFKSGVYQPWTE